MFLLTPMVTCNEKRRLCYDAISIFVDLVGLSLAHCFPNCTPVGPCRPPQSSEDSLTDTHCVCCNGCLFNFPFYEEVHAENEFGKP